MEIVGTNVNQAFSLALDYMRVAGVEESSRNGPVLVAPEPVITVYRRPLERVLFSPQRDANPFFHFFEALWMLAGRDDVAWVSRFNSRISQFSDNSATFWGAYGRRWRSWFGYNQLELVVEELRAKPDSRRAVLEMWDANINTIPQDGEAVQGDLEKALQGGKDVSCNTHAYFDLRNGALNMTVCCRSNDIVWGCYGANAVHFSFLQEYIAAALGKPVGLYRQFSNNWHLYLERYQREDLIHWAAEVEEHDYYADRDIWYIPLVDYERHSIAAWDADLAAFLETCERNDTTRWLHGKYQHNFFNHVAVPMWEAWRARKEKKDLAQQRSWIANVRADDWKIACGEWIERREAAARAKQERASASD